MTSPRIGSALKNLTSTPGAIPSGIQGIDSSEMQLASTCSKNIAFLRFPDLGPNDGRYDVTRLLCARLSQLRQTPRRDPASTVLSDDARISENQRAWNGLCGRPPLFIERSTPRARAHANQTGEDLRQVTLICEAAVQGHIPQRQSAVAQLLFGYLDANRQKPFGRCGSHGAAKCAREIAYRQTAFLSHLLERQMTVEAGGENLLGAPYLPCREPAPDRQ